MSRQSIFFEAFMEHAERDASRDEDTLLDMGREVMRRRDRDEIPAWKRAVKEQYGKALNFRDLLSGRATRPRWPRGV